MKKSVFLTILLLTGLILILSHCKKNPDIDIELFEIKTENVAINADYVDISGTFSYSGTINGINILVAENESFSQPKSFTAELEETSFSAKMTELKPATTYYYYYSIDFGLSKPYNTEKKSLSTLGNIPTVVIMETQSISNFSFRIKCEVISDGGLEVTERGICWNTYGDPNVDDETIQHSDGGLGQFSIPMTDLDPNTKYHIRAYAKNNLGIGYSETKTFQTGSDALLPTVSTLSISNISYHSVLCMGEVSSDGGAALTRRGVCWSMEPGPTVNSNNIVTNEAEIGEYSITIDGLEPSTDYYVRCFATNEAGTAYGEEFSFTTTNGAPTVTTTNVTDITVTGAKAGGNVTDSGMSAVIERGICWGTEENPSLDDYHTNNGSGEGEFEVTLKGLIPGTTYHVRAYARNSQEVAYGLDIPFTTEDELPTVETGAISFVASHSIQIRGEVTHEGASAVTEKGFCWSTRPNPSITDNHVNCGSGIGEFTSPIGNLSSATTYYIKAYAINSSGIKYGGEKSFVTLSK